MARRKKVKYFSLDNLDKTGADYRMAFGKRSNGKTYAVLHRILKNYCESGKQGAYIRRWREDFIGQRGKRMFEGLAENKVIETLTNNEYQGVSYYASAWYLAKYDEKEQKLIRDENALFMYGFSLSSNEHDKGASFPRVTTVFFDEFLARGQYLPDEFVLLMNTLSTIIRGRDDVVIYMMGNTVNKYCPYFAEMGLRHVKQMEQGSIDLYQYGEQELTVAIEYAEDLQTTAKSNKYFAFDNPKLQMITNGKWELAIYPHAPCKWQPKNIIGLFFIQFDDELLQCEIIRMGKDTFIYVHQKTTDIKYPDKELIYTTAFETGYNYNRRLTRPRTKAEKIIAQLFHEDKVYYQNNDIGEVVRNYLEWCNNKTFI